MPGRCSRMLICSSVGMFSSLLRAIVIVSWMLGDWVTGSLCRVKGKAGNI